MKRLLFLLLIVLLSCHNEKAYSQTYSYKYSHSVKDEVKIPGVVKKGAIFYFTFTNNKQKCYLSDKNGISKCNGNCTYKYVGSKNGILIYKEQLSSNFRLFDDDPDILYFSSNYSRLNWRCRYDDHDFNSNNHECLRVLQYISNPNTEDIPKSLF